MANGALVLVMGGLWGVYFLSSPNQETLEYLTMKDIKMQENMENWQRMHSMTAQDYIQRRLAAPNEPAPTPAPPDWVPPEVLKEDRKEAREKIYKPWALLPFFLLFIILFRRRRKRR